MRLGIAIDSSLCMACYNCYMACKDEHCGYASKLSAAQPQMGQFWMDVREWERGDNSRRVKSATVPTPCSHCQDAPCMKAAKDGAVYKRDDGIIIIDPEKAKGQKQIVDACPIGAIYWNEELQLPQKCTMCAELLDDPEYLAYLGDPKLKQPRCVEACPNRALIFGDLDDPQQRDLQEDRRRQGHPAGGPGGHRDQCGPPQCSHRLPGRYCVPARGGRGRHRRQGQPSPARTAGAWRPWRPTTSATGSLRI